MFKTLIVLAVSMTATTALLGWIDPSVPTSSSASTVEELLPHARKMVSSGLRHRRTPWRQVEVSVNGKGGRSDLWLTANPEATDHHFVIDEAGRLTSAGAWLEQTPVGTEASTIVVHLTAPRTGGEPTSDQMIAARALVLALNELAGPDQASLVITGFTR